jgi:hypothetical protein
MTYKTGTTTTTDNLRQYLKAVVAYNREQRKKAESRAKLVQNLAR